MLTKLFLVLGFLNSINAYFLREEDCLNYTIYPVQYEIIISPHLSKESSYYDCDLTITIIVNSPYLRVIELDAKNIDIIRESVSVTDSFDNRNIVNTVTPIEFDRRLGKLFINLKEDLEQYSVRRRQYYVRMSFSKSLTSDENGVFLVKYRDRGVDKQLIAARLSQNGAKHFFPCFENQQFEAIFKYRIKQAMAQEDMCYNTSLFVTEQLRETSHSQKNGYTTLEYKPSPQIGVHQTGFHYSSFSSIKVRSQVTKDCLILWAPESNLPQYHFILNVGQRILDLIATYSGVNLPIVNAPINVVAIPSELDRYEEEGWTLLTIGDHKLSHSPAHTSIQQLQQSSFQLSQQLSRIWLGNPGERRTRWKEHWFKEGVATFLGYYFVSHINQAFTQMDDYALQMRHKAMALDWRRDTPNLASFGDTLDIPPRYKNLVELKTSSLLWMVENWLGSEKFHSALVKYINARRGKYISVEDFTNFLQTETVECEFFKGYTVGDVLNSWLRQPGYPLLTVRVYRNKGELDRVHLEQKQFTFNNISNNNHKYIIPISYITEKTENCYNCFQPKFTIDGSGYSFKESLRDGWIILNRNASGYYRVNYDVDTWNMIIATLNGEDREKIDAANRAQIINDIFALYAAGEVSYSLAKQVVKTYEYENDLKVWDAAIDGFDLLKVDGASVGMSKYLWNDWKAIMREVISKVYRRETNNLRQDYQARIFKYRIRQFACSIGYIPCLKDMNPTLSQIKQGRTYDPDLRETAYFILQNQNSGYDEVAPQNRFEKEDFFYAKHKIMEERRFLYKLPKGTPIPMSLLLSTTETLRTSTEIILKADISHTQTSSGENLISSYFIVLTTIGMLLLKLDFELQ